MSNVEMARALTTLRTIVAAMAVGIVAFGGLVVFINTGGSRASVSPETAQPLLVILAGVVVAEIPAYVLVRAALTRRLARKWGDSAPGDAPVPEILENFRVLTLIGCAMAEGASLLGIVVLLVTGNWLAIVVPALGLALLGLQTPTRAKFSSFADAVTRSARF